MSLKKIKHGLLSLLAVMTVTLTGATYHAQETNGFNKQAKASITSLDGSNTTIDPIDGAYNIEIDVYGSGLSDIPQSEFKIMAEGEAMDPTEYSASDTKLVIKTIVPAIILDTYDMEVSLYAKDLDIQKPVTAPTLVPQRVDVNTGGGRPYHAVTYTGEDGNLYIRGSIPQFYPATIDGSKTEINANGGVDVVVEAQGINLDFFDPSKVKIKANDNSYDSDVIVNEAGTTLTITHTFPQSALLDNDLLISLVVDEGLPTEYTFSVKANTLTTDTQILEDKKTYINVDGDTMTMTLGAIQVNRPVITIPEDISIEVGTSLDILAGVRATDVEDGDLTSAILISNPDNFKGDGTDVSGTYKIIYTATDSDGNSGSATRVITVINPVTPIDPKDPGSPKEPTTPKDLISPKVASTSKGFASSTTKLPEAMTIAKTGLNSHIQAMVIATAAIVVALVIKNELNKRTK